jgi:hypothetical protein
MDLGHTIHLEHLKKGNKDLYQDFVNAVNRSKMRDKKTRRYLSLSRYKGYYDPLNGPTPAVMVLQGMDNGIGHAISLFEEYVVDSTWDFFFTTQASQLVLPSKFYSHWSLCFSRYKDGLLRQSWSPYTKKEARSPLSMTIILLLTSSSLQFRVNTPSKIK